MQLSRFLAFHLQRAQETDAEETDTEEIYEESVTRKLSVSTALSVRTPWPRHLAKVLTTPRLGGEWTVFANISHESVPAHWMIEGAALSFPILRAVSSPPPPSGSRLCRRPAASAVWRSRFYAAASLPSAWACLLRSVHVGGRSRQLAHHQPCESTDSLQSELWAAAHRCPSPLVASRCSPSSRGDLQRGEPSSCGRVPVAAVIQRALCSICAVCADEPSERLGTHRERETQREAERRTAVCMCVSSIAGGLHASALSARR